MPDDIALLKDYAETRSEAAFAELVSRYLNLVYSVAFRSTGNSHAAQEISQAVFIILARKAGGLSQHGALSGWLYQTARLTARNYLRTETRRQNREQEAFMQSTLAADTDPQLWPRIAPLLDDAMGRLGTADRNAIVERFFENKSLREVGLALGANEVAARMRVNRALEKLRVLFARRGVNSTTAAISENISRHSVQLAPDGLAKAVTVIALAKGATASTSVAALAKATLLAMKMKTIIATAAAVVVIAGITTWLAGFSHQPAAPAPAPVDTGPVQLNNAQFRPDGNKDGTFVVEVDPDTRRASNSTPTIHIKGPFASDTSDTVVDALAANGTYKKTDNSSSMQYYVTDSSVLYGKRVRVTFWLKTREVYGWVGTFVIIVGMDGNPLQHDDMSDRPIRGTTDWQKYEIVTDLPNKPCIIYLGPDLYGPGEVWADDFQIDLAPDEPVTDDRNWRISDESDPTLYSTALDPDVTHNGHPALCFSYTPNDPAPRGVHTRLAHDFYGADSDKYSGHTMRMSGWIKTENVSGRIEPTITPCAGWKDVLAKDSMYRDYSLKGTRDWTPFSVTCDIPDNTDHIRTGFVFSGSGKTWIDMGSLKYEIVK